MTAPFTVTSSVDTLHYKEPLQLFTGSRHGQGTLYY